MKKILQHGIVALALLHLCGCANLIAHNITKPSGDQVVVDDSFNDYIDLHRQCIDDATPCLEYYQAKGYQEISQQHEAKQHLSIKIKINDKTQLWDFNYDPEDPPLAPLTEDIIYLFPGWGTDPKIFMMHGNWLSTISGADVYILPSANASHRFSFGIDYLPYLKAHIQSRQPRKVHLIGFSMGAVAASHLHTELDNSALYLLAPMTDFRTSIHTFADKFSPWYATLVPSSSVDSAVDKVLSDATLQERDLDIVAKLNDYPSSSHIYLGNRDALVDNKPWFASTNKNLDIKSYDESHMSLITLTNLEMLSALTSTLLAYPVSPKDTVILGTVSSED
ncbi:hypothetical protein [Pseudoalteromonas sp. BDTF-M6]|uniref:hypothetical protein n=1 Tax=Pseudoalteromonas sp. BDTF-M6 TaxID=2796132 RepID=UPI001BAF6B4D|nr:hypothetical protein [Pseudoalteromonas sp. BDTF-M6]MBS3798592.1 hypothetical protein [Pseudoalteromonas sp. BDTF-M6]